MIEKLNTQFAQMPVVAILRGVRPEEVVDIGEALYSAGIGAVLLLTRVLPVSRCR